MPRKNKNAKHKKKKGGTPRPKTGSEISDLVSLVDHAVKYKYSFKEVARPRTNGLLEDQQFPTFVYKPYLHSSNIKLSRECERKFFFEQRLGLRRPGSLHLPFLRGRMYHLMAASLYEGDTVEEASSRVRGIALAEIRDTGKHVSSTGRLYDGRSWEAVEKTAIDQCDQAIAAAAAYYKYHPPNTDRYQVVAIEEAADIRVKGVARIIRGRLDLAIYDTEKDEIWIEDHKSSSKAPYHTAQAYKIDHQVNLYRLLALALFPDTPVVGMIHNVVQMPTIRFSGKDQGVYANYLNRVEEWYEAKIVESSVPGQETESPFFRHRYRFPSSFVSEDFIQELQRTSKMANCQADIDKFPKCGNAFTCTGFMESHICPFLSLCSNENKSSWKQQVEDGVFIQLHREELDE